jgi:hypothetical protein
MRFLQDLLKVTGPGRLLVLLIFALILSTTSKGQISVAAGTAPVTSPTGGFGMNGVLKVNSAVGDWLAGTGAGGFVLNSNGSPVSSSSTFHVIDSVNALDNVFAGGNKKNGNPNSWGWKTAGASPSKCNINHALIHIAKASNGDTWITISGDRESVNGNSFISLSLHQNSLTLGATTFVSAASNATGGRTPGDVQVSAEFTGGGSNPNLYLEEWKLVGSAYVWAPITIPAGKIVAYGKTNGAIITGMPYTVFGGTSYQVNSFIEVSFNISDIYRSSSTPCVGSIKSMLLLTKSSQSETADLADFVTPQQVNLDITVGRPTAAGANYCVGATINNLTATGAAGATFKWYTAVDANGKPTGSSTSGATYTPGISNASPGTANYYVTQTLDGCESAATTVTVTVVAPPTAYTLSGNSVCSSDGTGGILTLSNSQTGVSYQLKKTSDNSVLQSPKSGTTGSSLQWTSIPFGVDYYVEATGATPTSCKSTSNSASVTGAASPTVYTLTGNSICASAPNTGVLTLSNSQTGVSYQLKKASDNSAVQSAQSGTNGNTLQWTGLAAGVNYYVLATGAAPTSCTSQTTNASVTEVANPTVYNLSGNSICASAPNTGVITLSNSQTGVSYQLKKASDNSSVQSAQSGTNGSTLQWTGLAAGVNYYVLATGAAPTACTSQTANASVTEVANPTVYSLSGNSICSADPNTGVITLSNSQTGVSYQLKKASDNSSIQSAKSGTNGTALQWTDLPASINFYVEATGAAPASCTSTTSNASVSISQNPTQPTVEIVNPTCSTSTGTVKVLTPLGSGLEYSFNDGAFSSSVGPFTFQAGAGYKIEVKNTSSGCISVPQECSAEVKAFSSNAVLETGAVIPGARKTKVLAAPNPFNDRVKFTMESGISGQASLEIYNSLGQQIKVVYQGYIEAGRPMVKEFTVPSVQRGMLVYVFRVGNERVTGKLISSR